MGAVEQQEWPFYPKIRSQRSPCDKGVVVMEHPIVSNAWSHAKNSFSWSFKNFTVIKLINSVSLRHKFCMDNRFTVKKADERGFYF